MSLWGCVASDHALLSVSSGCHNGDHRLGGFSNRHLLSQFWRLEIRLLAGPVPSEASLLGLKTLLPASSPDCPSVSVCVNKHCLLDWGGGLHQPPGKGMQEAGKDVGFVTELMLIALCMCWPWAPSTPALMQLAVLRSCPPLSLSPVHFSDLPVCYLVARNSWGYSYRRCLFQCCGRRNFSPSFLKEEIHARLGVWASESA